MKLFRVLASVSALFALFLIVWYIRTNFMPEIGREQGVILTIAMAVVALWVHNRIDDVIWSGHREMDILKEKNKILERDMNSMLIECKVLRDRYWSIQNYLNIVFKLMLGGTKFKVTDQVTKTNGYPFNGQVVSVFATRSGLIRYVVELVSDDTGPVLHIFNEDQLEIRKAPEPEF